MYLRQDHLEQDAAVLAEFVRANPLGAITTAFPLEGQPTLQSTSIPFVLSQSRSSEEEEGEDGSKVGYVLRGHLARSNPHAKALIHAAKLQLQLQHAQPSASLPASNNPETARRLNEQVLIVFRNPEAAAGYLTPRFYTATKPTTGKVVPTWNYAEVHAYGRIAVYHDTSDSATDEFLSSQLEQLTTIQEARASKALHHPESEADDEISTGWKVSDAPKSYISILKKAIIGIEIQIDTWAGRFKMSQESSAADRKGVVDGFRSLATHHTDNIADFVEARGALKDKLKAGAK